MTEKDFIAQLRQYKKLVNQNESLHLSSTKAIQGIIDDIVGFLDRCKYDEHLAAKIVHCKNRLQIAHRVADEVGSNLRPDLSDSFDLGVLYKEQNIDRWSKTVLGTIEGELDGIIRSLGGNR